MGGETKLEILQFSRTICSSSVAIQRLDLRCHNVAHQISIEQRRTRRHCRRLSTLQQNFLLDQVLCRHKLNTGPTTPKKEIRIPLSEFEFSGHPRRHCRRRLPSTSLTFPSLPFLLPPSPKKSASSPLLSAQHRDRLCFLAPPDMRHDNGDNADDNDNDNEDDGLIFTSWNPTQPSAPTIRPRLFGPRHREKPKSITTTPGLLGAGETETEADEPPKRLPTARIIPASAPLVPPNTLQQRLTPLLFESSRLLSIVPAVCGTIYNLYLVYDPPTTPFPDGRLRPERIDYFVTALWAILTGFQCLRLTTGLFTRWRLYYPPLPTLIRLLALQAICWPATQLTLSVFDYERRPVATWALICTTTCCSRSVQIWVTSNLWWERTVWDGGPGSGGPGLNGGAGHHGSNGKGVGKMGYWKRWSGGAWGGRRWDWREVGLKCALPAGVLYFVMAWAEVLRREWSGC